MSDSRNGSTRWLRQTADGARGRLLLIAFGWLAFTSATEKWMRWGDPIRLHYATDELQYQAIARAAPGLPAKGVVSAAASQRLTAHWLTGIVAASTGLGLHTTYRIAASVVLLGIATIAVQLCLAFRLQEWVAALALGSILTNAYTTRVLMFAPAMLSDALLVLGVSIALLGLALDRPWLATAGCVVAVLGRETGLPVAVGVCVWLAVQRKLAPAVTALAASVVTFGSAKLVGETFALPDPSARAFTVISPMLRLPRTAGLLADHLGRVVIAAPVALVVLLAALLVLGLGHRLRLQRDPLAAALLLTALVMLQVVAFNPEWVMHNETRLAALGIVPLSMATAAAVDRTGIRLSRPWTLAVAVGIGLASLHHGYTYSGLLVSRYWYVAVETAVAASLAVCVLVLGTRGQRQPVDGR